MIKGYWQWQINHQLPVANLKEWQMELLIAFNGFETRNF